MDQDKIGKFIAKLRKDKNMTQEQLAEKLGVNSKSVSRWENGKCMPDLSLLVPLSKELGMGVNDLLSGKKNDKKGYQESLEENIVNIVSKVDNDNKKFRLKVVFISLFVVIIVLPLIVLCSSQFFNAPWISFSSFKIMNKADKFYDALQKNDIEKMDQLLTNKVEDMCWQDNEYANQTKSNFLDNLKVLKNKGIEYTSFKFKQAYYNDAIVTPYPLEENFCSKPKNDFLVEYEICFKGNNEYKQEKACIMLTFQLDNDKIILYSDSSDRNINHKILEKYNSASINAYYNKLHMFVSEVFNGHTLEYIEEELNDFE